MELALSLGLGGWVILGSAAVLFGDCPVHR